MPPATVGDRRQTRRAGSAQTTETANRAPALKPVVILPDEIQPMTSPATRRHRDRVHPIVIEIGLGEFADRFTILEIKNSRIKNPDKLLVVSAALQRMKSAGAAALEALTEGDNVLQKLREINEKLWDLENAVRMLEASSDFGPDFVAFARSIFRLNEERAALKAGIDASASPVHSDIKEYFSVDRNPG